MCPCAIDRSQDDSFNGSMNEGQVKSEHWDNEVDVIAKAMPVHSHI